MTTEPKLREEVSHCRRFGARCNKKDMQDIFLESGGLKMIIDVLVDHAWNKTGHKSSENGVSFSRPGTNNIEPLTILPKVTRVYERNNEIRQSRF